MNSVPDSAPVVHERHTSLKPPSEVYDHFLELYPLLSSCWRRTTSHQLSAPRFMRRLLIFEFAQKHPQRRVSNCHGIIPTEKHSILLFLLFECNISSIKGFANDGFDFRETNTYNRPDYSHVPNSWRTDVRRWFNRSQPLRGGPKRQALSKKKIYIFPLAYFLTIPWLT